MLPCMYVKKKLRHLVAPVARALVPVQIRGRAHRRLDLLGRDLGQVQPRMPGHQEVPVLRPRPVAAQVPLVHLEGRVAHLRRVPVQRLPEHGQRGVVQGARCQQVLLLAGVRPRVEHVRLPRRGVEVLRAGLHVRVLHLGRVARVPGFPRNELEVPVARPHRQRRPVLRGVVVVRVLDVVQDAGARGRRARRGLARQRRPLVHAVQRLQERAVNAQHAHDRGQPVAHVHQLLVGGAAGRLGEEGGVDEGRHAQAALPERVLAPPQRPVVAPVVRAPTIVASHNQHGVVPHALRLQCGHQPAHAQVKGRRQLAHPSPVGHLEPLDELRGIV
mmetsp:Transcript_17204/g.23640  ORF Transcript_17204/g.23640 Transcript_17204/m.23640 type:complete len:330 (-) Transcript_17204:479-1468(-)